MELLIKPAYILSVSNSKAGWGRAFPTFPIPRVLVILKPHSSPITPFFTCSIWPSLQSDLRLMGKHIVVLEKTRLVRNQVHVLK